MPFSVGTETGGSITFPADTNGVSALRPSFGLVGRSWIMSLAESLVSRFDRCVCDVHTVYCVGRQSIHRLDHEKAAGDAQRQEACASWAAQRPCCPSPWATPQAPSLTTVHHHAGVLQDDVAPSWLTCAFHCWLLCYRQDC